MPTPPALSCAGLLISVLSLGACAPTGEPTADCVSGFRWIGGDRKSPNMNPGLACIACHTAQRGPQFTVAGTIYAATAEPDLCDGVAGTTIEVTDSRGIVTTLTTNSAGNFYGNPSLTFPVRARVRTSTGTREMTTAASSGDCNTCHTAAGANGAPGRILAL